MILGVPKGPWGGRDYLVFFSSIWVYSFLRHKVRIFVYFYRFQKGARKGPKWRPRRSMIFGTWIWRPRASPRPPPGRPYFHTFWRWKCWQYSEILILLTFERFWRELGRRRISTICRWKKNMISVKPWGEFDENPWCFFTIWQTVLFRTNDFSMYKWRLLDLVLGTPRGQK